MSKSKVLITTPDYPPKLGGLSTFTKNLEKVFCNMGIEYETFVWNRLSDISLLNNKENKFELIIHVHFHAGLFSDLPVERTVNFFHGSEILFYSSNPIKRLIKMLGKNKAIHYIESCSFNIFISNFTFEKLKEKGLRPDYSRDIIQHNSILTTDLKLSGKLWPENETLKICCIARDVPHKNLDGAFLLAQNFSKLLNKKVQLLITSDRFNSDELVEVVSLINASDDDIKNVYRDSHLNFLLSLDHSDRGYFEGFGLTVLEAALYGTPSVVSCCGGLPENVHHKFNGYVLSDFDESEYVRCFKFVSENYSFLSENAFEHTKNNHNLESYTKLFRRLIGRDDV